MKSMITKIVFTRVKKQKFVYYSCIVSFIFLFSYALINIPKSYLGDAGDYFDLADQFYENGIFRFTNFPDNPRGYLFAFLLFLFKTFGSMVFNSPILGFTLLNCAMLSSFFCIIIPKLFAITFDRKYVYSAITTTIVFIYFWPDFITNPLSDVYALYLLSISILCIMKLERIIRNNCLNMIHLSCVMVLFGITLYACYNIRTVYQIPSVILLLFFLIRNWRGLMKIKLKIIAIIVVTLVGYFVTALPQMMLNQKYNDSFSSKVMTEKFYGEDLTLTQLYWGLTYARYETNVESLVGSTINYPSVRVVFVDEIGYKLMDENAKKSYANIIKSYFQHPIGYLKLYTRHLVNGMMPIFRETYITNMKTNKWPAYLLNYAILIIFVIVGYLNRKVILSKSFYTIGFLLVAFIAVPGAIETRFMLPAFTVVYGVGFYMFDVTQLKTFLSNKKILIVVIVLSSLGFLFTYRVLSTTLNSTAKHVEFTMDGE